MTPLDSGRPKGIYVNVNNIHTEGRTPMQLVATLDEYGKPAWIIAMIVLIASEVWFFPYQVDWHMLAYSTTDGKGFSYPLMLRINPIYAIAYLIALVAAIPYWRYLGLIG